jgi:hypothetical protein
MFVDQINTETAVTPLCRPQIAILNLEMSICSLPGEKARLWLIYPRSARRNEAIATANHAEKRTERYQTCHEIRLLSAKQRYARANTDLAIKHGSEVECHQFAENCRKG